MKLLSTLFMAAVVADAKGKGKKGKREKFGNSGKFGVCPTGDCAEKALTVEVDFIREIDSKGKKIGSRSKENMASTDFVIGTTENVTMGEPLVNASKYPFSTTFELKSGNTVLANPKLQFDTYFFEKSTFVSTGNLTTEISQDAVKFDVSVTGWKFADPNNTLDVGIKLKSKGAKKASPEMESGAETPEKEVKDKDGKTRKTKKQKTKKCNFGDMYFETPLVGLYDGVDGPVSVSQSSKGSSDSLITFSFSSFDNSVVYDPVIGGDNGGFKALPGIAALLASASIILANSFWM